MKNAKLILTTIVLATAALVWYGCKKDEPAYTPKSAPKIYGTISEKINGEAIQNATVELTIGQITKAQTKTNSDGKYEFLELKEGTYTIKIERIGYKKDSVMNITAEAGEEIGVDRVLERLPTVLKIMGNKEGNEIDSLPFGKDEGVTSLAFTIFNENADTLKWVIEKELVWISKLSETEGAIPPGGQQSVKVTIDRTKLSEETNTHKLTILSNLGYKTLIITAIGVKREDPELNMSAVCDTTITAFSAIFEGEIRKTGSPPYKKLGFVYSESPDFSSKTTLTVPIKNDNAYFKYDVRDLKPDTKYYVKAFAINDSMPIYSSNEVSFKTKTAKTTPPTVTIEPVTSSDVDIAKKTAKFSGKIGSAGEPAYTERGFVYGTTPNPTIFAGHRDSVKGTDTDSYSFAANNLEEGKTYYVRAYAIAGNKEY